MNVPNYFGGRITHWWLDRSFLFVGRMDLSKGIVEICTAWLRLFDRYGDACPPLWLVGGAPEEIDDVRAAIGKSKVIPHEATGKIMWWGYLDAAGITTLLVEQNLYSALAVADRCYIIDQGEIKFEGTPDQVRGDEELRRRYLHV